MGRYQNRAFEAEKKKSQLVNSWLYKKGSDQTSSLRFSSICRYNDKLYIGSFNRFEGLFVVDTATMEIIKKITFYGGNNGWSEIGSVQCYYRDTLWLGTTNGLLWLDINSWKYGCVTDNKGDTILPNSEPVLWPADKTGKAWLCDFMNGKVGYYDTSARTFTFFTANTKPQLPFESVKHIVYDANNNVWIAGHGLARWNDNSKQFDIRMNIYAGPNKYNDDILAITADQHGALWLFNAENVLLEYRIKEQKFYTHDASEGLPVFVQSMADYVNDNLWFTTGSQLLSYNPNTKKIYYFNQGDGLPVDRASSRTIFFDKERNCFYSLHNNYVAVFPASLTEKSTGNKKLLITKIALADATFYNPPETLFLNYNQNSFSLHFSVLDYDESSGYNFYYHIDKKDWINLDGQQVIFFNSLAAGDHKINIMARGKLGEQYTTNITLAISFPFWQTWWFIAAVSIFTGTIIYALIRYRFTQLKKLFEVRAKISRDLHDEVGATLSGIAMYSHLTKEQMNQANTVEVEKSLDIMQRSAGEMVNKLNDIVWLVNPEQDSLQKLTQRLEEYAYEMAITKNMNVRIHLPQNLAKLSLPLESRRNIYLFCKEAINNAVKYSNGTLLELNIKEVDNKLEFSVSDNGKGFDAVMVRRGNGLDNMQKRADEIGAKLLLQSKQDEGCFVSMQLKIT